MGCSRILIIGSLNVVFVHSYALSFRELGVDVAVLDIGVQPVDTEHLSKLEIDILSEKRQQSFSALLKGMLKVFLKYTKIDRTSVYIEMIDKVSKRKRVHRLISRLEQKRIIDFNPTHILYIWSTTVHNHKSIIDGLLLENCLSPSSSLVINTYPVRADYKVEDDIAISRVDETFFQSFDLILYFGLSMQSLFTKLGYNGENGFIHDDRLHPEFFNLENNESETRGTPSDESIVFLGTTEFNERTLDDVHGQLVELLDTGLEVWIQKPKNRVQLDKRLKLFEPFTFSEMMQGKLAKFVSQFSGAYMGYNNLNNARTQVSFPTRFALAMTGGIPIFLEKDNWKGIKERFSETVRIVEFDDVIEIATYIRANKSEVQKFDIGKYESDYLKRFSNLVDMMEVYV